jgi:Cytochrome C oxidase, cbb3-type, subunit III
MSFREAGFLESFQRANRVASIWIFAAAGLLALCAGCRQDMHVQPRYNPFDPADFFEDGQSARMPVAGTVPRGDLVTGPHELLYTGKVNGTVVDEFPFPVTREVLERGRERFNIYCEPCHGMAGDGDGMIVQRGFRHPPSLHSASLRSAPAGHFFDVISNGFGAMYPYGYRIAPRDRWAIISYIRALQLSRQASINDVAPEERKKLQGESR